MSLSDALKVPKVQSEKELWDHWSKEIAFGCRFYEHLLRATPETDWSEMHCMLNRWIYKVEKIKKKLERINKEKKKDRGLNFDEDVFRAQLEHAFFMLDCAWFSSVYRQDLLTSFPPDHSTVGNENELTDLLRSEIRRSKCSSYEKTGRCMWALEGSKSHECHDSTKTFSHLADLDNDLNRKARDLIWAFHMKGELGEKREIRVATINKKEENDPKIVEKGPLCALELKRIKGVGCASPDPTYFPSSDETRFVTGPDFVDAINKAFSMNRINWPKEFKELEEKIDGLEKDQAEGRLIVKSALEGLRAERDFLNTADKNSTDHIDRYSILWRVRLYNEDEEIPPGIDGRSVGLAAYVGIYFALRNKFPDERSIYSAAISGDETKGFTLERVEGLPEKIQATLGANRKAKLKDPNGIPPFDGFGIHKSNLNELDEDLLKTIRDENFQIFVLNDDGAVMETYP